MVVSGENGFTCTINKYSIKKINNNFNKFICSKVFLDDATPRNVNLQPVCHRARVHLVI